MAEIGIMWGAGFEVRRLAKIKPPVTGVSLRALSVSRQMIAAHACLAVFHSPLLHAAVCHDMDVTA